MEGFTITQSKYAKEVGILLNYLLLLLGLYAWDLSTFYIILAFACDYAVVILIVTVLTLVYTKSKLIAFISALEVLIGGLAIGGLQIGFVLFILNDYPLTSGWTASANTLLWAIPSMALPMLIFHTLPLRKVSDKSALLDTKRSDLLTISVGFLLMGFIGLLVMECYDPPTILPIITAMIIVRMLLEVYMNHLRKEKPQRKTVNSSRK